MDLDYIILIGIVLIAGSTLQSAAGFGFGMFAIPILILMGSQSYEAITIIAICSAVQTIIGAYTLRAHIHWKQAAGLTAVAVVFIPAGIWVQHQITFLDTGTIRQIFGGIILTVLTVQWLWRAEPVEHLHWKWGAAAMILCGFMAGVSGMGGPPLIMWVMAHSWSNERSRATIWAVFTGLTPLQLLFLYQRFGDPTLTAMGTGALLTPAVLLGLLPGLWIGRRIPKPTLRRASYVILLIISLYAILQPAIATALTASN
ncbi:MAG: sulfite exporter TauE/SafE family protein [Phycisphaerales bacterium]|nr:sulfite exporter TauE/SafE family protein [Phycisphaerales bacterium]